MQLLNKRVLESLIKSGAMDSLGRRSQLMDALDKAMEQAQKAARDREAGQHGLFGIFEEANPVAAGAAERLPNTPGLGRESFGWRTRRRFWASGSADIRWRNTRTRSRTCTR